MDAWETLAAHSVSGDAWERLNSITGGGAVPGEPIRELDFTLEIVTIEGIITIPVLSGSVSEIPVTGIITPTVVSSSGTMEEI